ncbi:hypothetical protein BCR34DRAFT_664002 [Clohesyomyces aquaticus]|uniref:DUF6604 domain-containing protein n=1 Tax=Clohesyomyces aquaticus TaxID=1231657 RepID=A0A1Y1ZPF2_9PLEO|nr:hypothetical protein BCR34DRAFT_664002 [Clohesyomyces aquaticus]
MESSEHFARLAQEADNKSTHAKGKSKYKIPLKQFVPLVQEIFNSGAPLENAEDTVRDINDAIRTHKEVTEYYRVTGKADEEHTYFTNHLIQNQNDDVDPEPRGHLFIITNINFDVSDQSDPTIPLQDSEDGKDEQKNELTSVSEPNTENVPLLSQVQPKVHKHVNTFNPSKEEMEREQYFQVLCYLYDFQ